MLCMLYDLLVCSEKQTKNYRQIDARSCSEKVLSLFYYVIFFLAFAFTKDRLVNTGYVITCIQLDSSTELIFRTRKMQDYNLERGV